MYQFEFEKQKKEPPVLIYAHQFASLGEMLKAMRVSNAETQQSLARKLGTCRQHVQKWEYDITRPSPKRLHEIFATLNYRGNLDIYSKFYK